MTYLPPPPLPPKRTNVALIVSLAVGVPLLLILCCVATVVVGPVLGFTILERGKADMKAAVAPVAGTWENTDGSVKVYISPWAGDTTIYFADPLKSGHCQGGIKNPANPAFPLEFYDSPCGPITGKSGMIKVNGRTATLTIPGIADIALHKTQ